MSFGIKPDESWHTSASIFEDFPAQTARLSPQERKQISKTARTLFKTSPSDAISYLAGTRGYTNFRPDLLMGKLMARPVKYEKFAPIASSAFGSLLGRKPNEGELESFYEQAKIAGIKDPSAFEAFLSGRLASTPEGQAKIKTEADIAWESMYGTMQRDPTTGALRRGMVDFDPVRFASTAKSLGNIFSSSLNI